MLFRSEGPIIARRFKQDELNPDQAAFQASCRAAGFPESPDHNHPEASGIGPIPFNNPNGIRFSTAIGYLTPARHRLNLTIRPNCTTRRIIFEGKKAVGVEVESGGEIFTAEADQIILSSGAIGSPQIMLLSGVGPATHLQEMGLQVVHDLPGVGQNLRDHPMIYVTFKTKEGFPLDGFAPRVQMGLRWTSEGSEYRNDLMILMQSYATERIDRGGERMEPLGVRMLGVLDLAMSAGELKLTSTDPSVQPLLDYRYLRDPFYRQRMRELVQIGRASCRVSV